MPLDKKGAEILLVAPSADFFAEPHIDSLIGYAKVLHQAGITWTLSSHASEAGNFGMFIGSHENMQKVAARIREAARDLSVKRVVFGECGHAWRVAYNFFNTLAGIGPPRLFPIFASTRLPPAQHICEFTYDLMRQGALTFDKSKNEHRLTFHDSCNVSRASRMGDVPGGQFDIPRGAAARHRQQFLRHGARYHPREHVLLRRRRGAAHRRTGGPARQGRAAAHGALREVADEHGVTLMAAICAICKAQFSKVLP